MKSIFASKLYKASTRKDRIQAAIIAPTNLTLVQQLADSLDEEFKTPDNLGLPTEEEKAAESETFEDVNDFIVDEDIDPEKDLMTVNDLGGHSGGHSSMPHTSNSSRPKSDSDVDKPEGGSDNSEEAKTDSNLMPDSPATEEPAEASTKIKSATSADLNILKNTLNGREDTAGVLRISEKDGEVWIYYNDETNLNNIMTNVIELLMSFGYESFEFNRLARSDNAIVFVKLKEV